MADKIIFEVIATAKGVKVVQQQTDKLAKSTDKADKSTKKLDKSRDAYNRREKGAANISSNSTKNFSKMQQGIDGGGGSGGLVRAYALLAANVFALTAAFGVLSRSAQIDTLTQSMEVLSTTGGIYIKNLAKEMQIASGGAIDLAQAFSQVSLASSAGLSTTEIEGLTKVAKGAAISLGRNLPDAMDRIFRGAIKLEPEILDEIGLFIRVDEAAQKFARNNGKVVSSLSQVEKRQAFLNEILEQGGKKFAVYAETIQPDAFVRIAAALGDVAQTALSLVNRAFNPLLNMLADSKSALTLVFGVVVFSLLKLAIPAIGQFNQKLAQNAIQAKENADKYVAGLRTTAQAQSDHTKHILAEKNKVLQDDFSGIETAKQYGRGSKQDKADLAEMNSTTDNIRKQELTKKRIAKLDKQKFSEGSKYKSIVDKELKVLRKQKKVLDEIVRNEKTITAENEKQLKADKKYLAGRNQEKLISKAETSGAVAGISGTAEMSGMSAGFKDLGDTLKHGIVVEGEEGRKKLKGMQKATVALKGSVGILGVGFSNLMAMMGPIMIAFGVLMALGAGLAKMLKLNSEESKAFDESLSAASEASENLTKRFKTQTDQLNSGLLSYIETNNAQLAFNKGMSEASENTIKMNKSLEEFKRNASDGALAWEKFKAIFGLDRETEALDQQLKTVKEQIEGMARESGAEGAKDFFNIKGAKDYAISVEELQRTEQNYAKAKKDAMGDEMSLSTRQTQILEDYRKEQLRASDVHGQLFKDALHQHRLKKLVIAGEKEGLKLPIFKAIIERSNALNLLNAAYKRVVGSTEQLTDVQENSLAKSKPEADRLAILKSNIDGAAEAMGKFTSNFQTKTKVDDVVASFDSMSASIVDMSDGTEKGAEKVKDFYKSVGTEKDNPFSKLFNEEELKQLATGSGAVWESLREQVDQYRQSIIMAAAKQSELARVIKQLSKFQAGGQAVNVARYTAEAKSLKITADLKKSEHEMILRKNNMTQDQLDQGIDIIEQGGTIKEIEDALLNKGLNRADVLAAMKTNTIAITASAKELEATETATAKATIDTLKAKQKIVAAQKALTESQLAGFKLEQQVHALETRGSVKLAPKEEAAAAIESAKKKLEMTIAEAKIKMSIIDAERQLLMIRVALLTEEQAKEAGIDKGAMIKNLKALGDLQKATLSQTLTNAAAQFKLDMGKAVSDSFKHGITNGIRTGGEVLKEKLAEIEERRKEAVGAAITKSNEEGGSLSEGISAGLAASKPFDTETDAAKKAAGVQMMREGLEGYAAELAKLGPEGELISSVIQGAYAISDAFKVLSASESTGMAKAAETAEFAAQALQQIGQMMAANSKAQVAEIDNQINAEKKRDGKSAESMAKIKQLEAKKLAMQKKAFEQNKKMQMATTIVSTAASIMQVAADPSLGWYGKLAMGIMFAAMGAAQLAIISKTKFQGGAGEVEKPKMTALSIGKRDNKVDVSRGAAGGEMSYLRGGRGVGSNANDFRPTGGAYGIRSYGYAGEGILVGEQGPEVVTPTQPVDVLATGTNGGAQNVNFTINTIDSQGVADFLDTNQGAIIQTIRGAANGYGTGFLEEVDTTVLAPGG